MQIIMLLCFMFKLICTCTLYKDGRAISHTILRETAALHIPLSNLAVGPLKMVSISFTVLGKLTNNSM